MSDEIEPINIGNREPNIKVVTNLLSRADSLLEKIFNSTVENHQGCWLWMKSCFSSGYGQQSVDNKNWRVHRLVYSLINKDFDQSLVVRHLCGNRRCCNPLHLKEGTLEDNAKDSVVHGTSRLHNIDQNGVNNHMAKLDEESVYEMRRLYGQGDVTFEELGSMFGVSRKPAERAVRGQTYPEFTKVAPIPVKRKSRVQDNNV